MSTDKPTMTRDQMAKHESDNGQYSPGPASRERFGYMVLGAVLHACIVDGMTGPDDMTQRQIVDLTYDADQAMMAIRAVAASTKFDRATSALGVLRRTNAMAGRR